MAVPAEGADVDHRDVDLEDLVHIVEVLGLPGRHVGAQGIHGGELVADRHEAGVRDVRVEHPGLDLALRLRADHFDRGLDGVQERALLLGLSRHLDAGAVDGPEEDDQGRGLVLVPFPGFLRDLEAVQSQVQGRIIGLELLLVSLDRILERLAVLLRQLVVELLPGVDPGLPRQRLARHVADLAEPLPLGVQVLDDAVHGLDADGFALLQHLGRVEAVGEVVVVGEGDQGGLYGVRALGVHLLQGDRRDRHLALCDVAQVRVQGHVPGHFRDQQVRVEGAERGADVGLLAEGDEARQELADAAVVDVAVLIARRIVRGVVRVDAGDVLKALFLLEVHQHVQAGDDALGVVLLVALRELDQVAVQLLRVLGEVLHDDHVARDAGLHVQSASAEHELAGVDVVDDVLRQVEVLLQDLRQVLRIKGVVPVLGEVVHADGVDVAEQDDGFVEFPLVPFT